MILPLAFVLLVGRTPGEPRLPESTGGGPVVVFGNSIAEGFIGGEIDTVSRYSNLLRQDLANRGYSNRIINAGMAGNTCRDGYLRLDEDVLRYDPSVVTISFGLNDLRVSEEGTPNVPIDEFHLYLGAIVERVRESGAAPVLLSLVPIVYERFYQTHDRTLYDPLGGVEALWGDYDKVVRSVGSEHDLEVVDLLAGFSDSLDLLIGEEGIHPNELGHRAIADLILPPVIGGLEDSTGMSEEREGEGIEEIRLFPNPFRSEPGKLLRIAYRTVGEGWITIEIFSISGRRVAIPVNDLFRIAGNSTEFWDGRGMGGESLPPGVYLVKIAWTPASGAKPALHARKVAIVK